LNQHQDDLFAPHWSPHVHLIAGAEDIDELRSDLKAAFPKSQKSPRPVVATEWDGNADAFSYVFKPNFNRRIRKYRTIQAEDQEDTLVQGDDL
jgi:hypothetical protein